MVGSFSAVFVIPSVVEESLIIFGNPPDNNFDVMGKDGGVAVARRFLSFRGVANSEASRMGPGISSF